MNSVSFSDLVSNIMEAMESLSGEEVAKVHNEICSRKIRYVEDSQWEYTEEDDNDSEYITFDECVASGKPQPQGQQP